MNKSLTLFGVRFAVTVTRCPDGGVDEAAVAPATAQPTQAAEPILPAGLYASDRLQDAKDFGGLIADVARQCGTSPSHVLRVASGERRSPNVEAALSRALQKRELAVLRRTGGAA